MNEHPSPVKRPRGSSRDSNLGTVLAVMALLLCGGSVIALLGIATGGGFFFMIPVIIMGTALMGMLHYVVWGRALSEMAAEAEENDAGGDV